MDDASTWQYLQEIRWLWWTSHFGDNFPSIAMAHHAEVDAALDRGRELGFVLSLPLHVQPSTPMVVSEGLDRGW